MQNEIPDLPDSILKDIYLYSKERTKAPDEIIFWTVFSLLGATLKNNVYIDWAVKTVFPNFPLLIVAPSGWGKTGAVNSTMDIFNNHLPYLISEDSTAESFVKEFATCGTRLDKPDATASIWVVPELADIFGKKKYQEGLIARITRILDAPKNRKVNRMNGEAITLNGYALFNLIACTTYQWLETHVEESASTGGFLPRMFVIYTTTPPRMNLNPKKDRKIEAELSKRLDSALRAIKGGPVEISPALEEYLKLNYNDHMESIGFDNENVVARRDENFLRMYLIMRAFCGITHEEDVLRLCYASCKSFEYNNVGLFTNIKNNKMRKNYDNELHLSVVRKFEKCVNQTLFYSQVCRDLHRHSHEVRPILTNLKENGYINWDGITGETGKITISAHILDAKS